MLILINVLYIVLIGLFLIIAGWLIKAGFALLSGKPVNFNLYNPLNLKARWPKKNNETDLNDK